MGVVVRQPGFGLRARQFLFPRHAGGTPPSVRRRTPLHILITPRNTLVSMFQKDEASRELKMTIINMTDENKNGDENENENGG